MGVRRGVTRTQSSSRGKLPAVEHPTWGHQRREAAVPLYVYKNLSTGETFEIEQSMADDALTAHPETGDPVKRIIQPVGIAFKGSGFYVNDSRKGAAPKKSSDGGTAKTDSKTSKPSKSGD